MRAGCAWRGVAAALGAAAALRAAEGPADAQYLLSCAGGGAARRAKDALAVVDQAEQAIDLGRTTLGGWLFWAAGGMIDDALRSLPDADAAAAVACARRRLEKNDAAGASRALSAAGNELRRLAAYWDVGEAEPCCAALAALAEAGDCRAALEGRAPLERDARLEPARTLLETAAGRISAAEEALSRGRGLDAIARASEAKSGLRAAILAARLTRAKILVAHARIMESRGARFRARWTMGRARRALARAEAFAGAADADASKQIRDEIDAVRQLLRAGKNARAPLAGVEAKISALVGRGYGPWRGRHRAGEGG